MTAKRITEIKTTLAGEEKTFACELLHYAPGEAIVVYRMPQAMQLEQVHLPRGTISVGYFWEDRPFNAYHWVDAARQTLALYFNICDNTRISATAIAWRDLTVDVLMTPDMQCRVLDEDELPRDLDAELRAYIARARDRLCADADALLREFGTRSRALLGGD